MNRKAVLFSVLSLSLLSIKADDSQALVRLKDGQQQMLGALAACKQQRVDSTCELHSVHVHHTLGALKLLHDGNGYVVKDNKGEHHVAKHDLDALLQRMPAHALPKFQQNGYIEVKCLSNGEYKLLSHVRGDGGGPLTGWCAYVGTKATGYAAFGAAVWATGGEALLHTVEAMEAIEAAAMGAGYLGTIAPTP